MNIEALRNSRFKNTHIRDINASHLSIVNNSDKIVTNLTTQ